MASVHSRKYKSGEVVWRVTFRREGIRTISYTFLTEDEARRFARKTEPVFLKDPKEFLLNKKKIRRSGRRQRDHERIVRSSLTD